MTSKKARARSLRHHVEKIEFGALLRPQAFEYLPTAPAHARGNHKE